MDSQNFDQLTRIIGASVSRRAMLKALASGALGAVAAATGLGDVSATARRRSVGNSCNTGADCASGLCATEGRSRKICHCVSAADCPRAKDACHSATCTAGVCGIGVAVGATCDDRNACTTNDICQANGACMGTPLTCAALDQCHDRGICDPKTGMCSNPVKQNGVMCNDGNLCTQTDTCQNGVCTGSNPVSCMASDQCHEPGTCDPTTGSCSNPVKPDGATCQSGGQAQACQGGVCCTPTTCEEQGVSCGSVSDGCNATLQCGGCAYGMVCHEGQCICPSGSMLCGGACEHGSCCTDGDCEDRGPCYTRKCDYRQVGQSYGNVCVYTHIPGCCASDADCSPDPCDVSVSCNAATNQCVHTSACFGCNVCDPSTGGCTRSNCPDCQYCGPGGACAADLDTNYDLCTPPNDGFHSGICTYGECLTCIPNDRPCQGPTSGDECCSGKCLHDINSEFFSDYVCTCRTLIEYCDNDAQCCQGNCAWDELNGGNTCQPSR